MLIPLGIVALIVIGLGALRRRPRGRPGARTVELVVGPEGLRRRLADGREEQARWARVRSVELVRTPVTTVDGARAFLLVAEDDRTGCLAPLGVGWDRELVVGLSRLPGFDVGRFDHEVEERRRGRLMLWERPGAQPSTEGTGSS